MFMTGVLCTVYGAQVYLYDDSDTPPQLVSFYDTLGIRITHSRLNPRALTGAICTSSYHLKPPKLTAMHYNLNKTCSRIVCATEISMI